jgi:hypothetical protein
MTILKLRKHESLSLAELKTFFESIMLYAYLNWEAFVLTFKGTIILIVENKSLIKV